MNARPQSRRRAAPALGLTPREVSELAGAPHWTVEKAIEQTVLVPDHGQRAGRKRRRLLPLHAVAYVRVVAGVDLRLSIRMKRRLVSRLSGLAAEDFGQARVELAPAVELDLGRLVGDTMMRAQAYALARDAMIVEDETGAGEPVVRGLGLSVYALAARAGRAGGAGRLRSDYPELPEAAVEAALIYARAHPPLGRRPTRSESDRLPRLAAEAAAAPAGPDGAA